MDIFISKKMRNFILLAQTNNIARAAEKIHMTASPFGKSIAALEDQIGYTLFTRKDNNISLNKAGQELYQKLFPVYQRLSAIDNEIHNASRRSREIVIGIDNTYPTIIFDQLISLGDKYDGVTAQAVEFSENGVIDNLFDRKLDLLSRRSTLPASRNWRIWRLASASAASGVSRFPALRRENSRRICCASCPGCKCASRIAPTLRRCWMHTCGPAGSTRRLSTVRTALWPRFSAVERGQFLTVIPHFAWRLVNPSTLKYFDAPGSPMYMQEFLYSLKNHRYTATMLQHIAEDRDGSAS